MMGELKIVMSLILLRLTGGVFNKIPIKIPAKYFVGIDTAILKFIQKNKDN